MMRDDRIWSVLLARIGLLAETGAQSAEDLFEDAELRVLLQGDPDGAIELYERIVTGFASDRALVAQALYRLGEAYDRLGDARARTYFERIAAEFSDQAVPAARAREWLAAAPGRSIEIATPYSRGPWNMAISPDGRYLVALSNEKVSGELWLHNLETGEAGPIPGTEGAGRFMTTPFWSPDSRSIGFFAGGESALKRVDVDGGNLRRLARARDPIGGAWGPEDVIVFFPSYYGGLYRIPADGSGEPVVVEGPLPGSRFPQFLADGHLFYSANGRLVARSLEASTSGFMSLASVRGVPVVAEDYLIFATGEAVRAQRFDLGSLVTIGESIHLAEARVVWNRLFSVNGLSASAAGTVAYRPDVRVAREFVWFDRSGTRTGTLGQPDTAVIDAHVRISKDGRVAFNRGEGLDSNVWLFEPGENESPRLLAAGYQPVWSPDDERVATTTIRGYADIYLNQVDGPSEWALPDIGPGRFVNDWSPNGDYILHELDTENGRHLIASRIGTDETIVVADSPGTNWYGRFSPAGDWIVYVSNRSGRHEVYLQPFPVGGNAPIRVSPDGGHDPQWRNDGREIYYMSDDYEVMAVPVTAGEDGRTIELGERAVLFTLLPGSEYEADGSGERFLVTQPTGEGGPPIVILSDRKR